MQFDHTIRKTNSAQNYPSAPLVQKLALHKVFRVAQRIAFRSPSQRLALRSPSQRLALRHGTKSKKNALLLFFVKTMLLTE